MKAEQRDTFDIKNNYMFIKNALEGKRLKVRSFNQTYDVEFSIETYYNGRPAACLYDVMDGAPFATLTCNIPEIPLEKDEIIVKVWSENAILVKPCLASGLFEDSEKRIPTGFVIAEIWKVKPEQEKED